MNVLLTYLPAMMSREDLSALIDKITLDLGLQDLNKER
jgi:hypothetical protein